jgi:cytochrome b561
MPTSGWSANAGATVSTIRSRSPLIGLQGLLRPRGVGTASSVAPKYLTLVAIHKTLGIAILILALIRLAVRLRYGAPPLPADLPEPMKLAAHRSHYALYALMIAMPMIGWAMLSAAEYPVVL